MGQCVSKSSKREKLITIELRASENSKLKTLEEKKTKNLFDNLEDYLRLELYLEKNLVDPGETLKGHIHIHILDTLLNCELILKFTGEVLRGCRNGQRDALFLLKNWIEPVCTSQVCIPFELIIPKNIQRSMCSFGGAKRHLKYYLEPVFKSHKGINSVKELVNIEYDEGNFKNKPFIQILEHNHGKIRGEISIKRTWINRISYSGSPIEIGLEINNQRSLVDIISVEFSVSLWNSNNNIIHVADLKKWELKISIEKGTLLFLENQTITFDSPNNLKYFEVEYWLSITIKTFPKCDKTLTLWTQFGMRPLIPKNHISLKDLPHLHSNVLPTVVLTYNPLKDDSETVIYQDGDSFVSYGKTLIRD